MIEEIIERAKQNKKRIILPESYDKRILKAAEIVKKENIAIPILIGKEEHIKDIAKTENLDITGIEIINPTNFKDLEELIDEFYNLRKEKGITLNDAKNIITNNYIYFSNILLYKGYADGIVCGAVATSSDSLRPALQIIKTKEKEKIASSFFIMELDDKNIGYNGCLIYTDCGLNQNPTAEELVDIASIANDNFKLLTGKNESKIAFLSHSTNSSSICKDQEKMKKASLLFKEKYQNVISDGEMQFDTAIDKEVAKIKMKESIVAGHANILVFPDLDAANIAYKITERLAHAKAYGPITGNLRKPVNDLSRGSSYIDIVGTIAITALQANEKDINS